MHNLILNTRTLPAVPFDVRVNAARGAGYRGIGLGPTDYKDALAQGLDDAGMLALLADAAVEVTEIGFATGWLQGQPGVDADEATLWHMADVFRPRQLNAGMWEAHSFVDLTHAFGILCDRAASKGLLVALEFIPYSGIRDLLAGWRIVDGAARTNGGLILDTWQFHRAGTPHDVLTTVTPEKWFTLQLADAAEVPWPQLSEESRHGRLLPGEGVIDFESIVGRVMANGADPIIGVEVISDALHRLDPTVAARSAIEPSVALLDRLDVRPGWWRPPLERPGSDRP